MDATNWVQVLIQLPIVGVFIWYSLELQRRYQDSNDKRDEAYLKVLEKIADKLDKHDREIGAMIASIKDGQNKLAGK